MTLLRGRQFTAADQVNSTRVAIVNEAFVKRFMSDRDPIGRRFVFGEPEGDSTRWLEVVGVVRDAKRDGMAAEVRPYMFRPLPQYALGRMQVMVRAHGDPMALVPAIREALRRIDPQQPLSNIRLLDQDVARSLAPRRFVMLLLSTFAVAAVVLAAIGIYGVISYMVGRRTREFGLRMALGAEPTQVLGLVMRQAGRQVLAGVVLGTAGAFAAARLLQGQLFGVSGIEPVIELLVVGVLTAVAAVAVYVPARRATCADPLIALRAE
jgi:putative ABC transport system permease protein